MKHLINLERLKVHLSNKFKTTLNEIDEFLQLVVFRHEISELNYKEFELLIGESKQKLLGFWQVSLGVNPRLARAIRLQLYA